MIEPIIAVDVDDVVADLLTTWCNLYNLAWHDCLTPEMIRSWDVHEYVKPECGRKVYDLLHVSKFYDFVKPFRGAKESIDALRDHGRVIFVSSCVGGTMDDKYSWLVRWGFVSNVADFVPCKDKWLVGADFLIDDGIHNVEAFRGKKALLVNRPHNEDVHTDVERLPGYGIDGAPARVQRFLTTGV